MRLLDDTDYLEKDMASSTRALRNATRALADVPYFDHALAVEIILVAGAASDAASASTIVMDAFEAGGIETFRGVLRVPEPVAARLGATESDLTYDRRLVAAAFAKRAPNELSQLGIRAFGADNHVLLAECYSVSADPFNLENADVLARRLFSSRDHGRAGDLRAARLSLSGYLAPGHYMLSFLDALQSWNAGDKKRASNLLASTIQVGPSRTVLAMSHHLLGAYSGSRREWKRARRHLKTAVELFDNAGDAVGSARALASMALTVRTRGVRANDLDRVASSLKLFSSAERRAQDIPAPFSIERRQTLGRIQIGLSRTYRALGFDVKAIDSAYAAHWDLEHFNAESIWARHNLATMLRAQGRSEDAANILLPALKYVMRDDESQRAALAATIELALNPEFLDSSSADDDSVIERGIKIATQRNMIREVARFRLARARRLMNRADDLPANVSVVEADLRTVAKFASAPRPGVAELRSELRVQEVKLSLLRTAFETRHRSATS